MKKRLTFRQIWPLFVFTALALWAVYGECAWFEYKPRGSQDGQGILREMLSRCPQHGLGQIRGFDKATQCHEATHFCNGELSRKYGHDYCAFYVGGGRCFVVTPPNVTIGQVARIVPQRIRNSRHRIYFANDRIGRNCLSLIDEWTCYANDAQCTKELSLPYDGGLEAAQDFAVVADCVVAAVKQHDPQYAHLPKLLEFVEFHKRRVAELAGQPLALYTPQTYKSWDGTRIANLGHGSYIISNIYDERPVWTPFKWRETGQP